MRRILGYIVTHTSGEDHCSIRRLENEGLNTNVALHIKQPEEYLIVLTPPDIMDAWWFENPKEITEEQRFKEYMNDLQNKLRNLCFGIQTRENLFPQRNEARGLLLNHRRTSSVSWSKEVKKVAGRLTGKRKRYL